MFKTMAAILALMLPATMVSAQGVTADTAPAATSAMANMDLVRKGFDNLSDGAKIYVQKVMKQAGTYDKPIDGIYGPSTEAGVVALSAWLSEKSGGSVSFDLSTGRGVTDLYKFVRDKGAETYLQ